MIDFIINGEPHSYEPVGEKDPLCLLDYLRNTLNLTGTKRGCEERVCGACTVLVDGKAVKSCAVKMTTLQGKEVTTIEGLSKDGTLDPLQEAFIEYNAVQCGFCTPGIILGAKGLLNENLTPTEEDIKKALKPNLCRCGTYPRVIMAIQKVAAQMRGEDPAPYQPVDLSREGSFIGKSMPRRDLPDKVTGRTKFFGDYRFENTMYGKAVYSEYPSAKVLSIDTSEAEKADGVVCVLTAKDVPGLNRYGVLCVDQPVFAEDRVRHIGEVMAVVFAESDAQAIAATKLVKVDYEELPGVFSIEDAMAEDAPVIPDPNNPESPIAFARGERGNLCTEVHLYRGHVDDALAGADAVVEGTYHTKAEDHAWIECDGTVSFIDENGHVAVLAPNQSPFADREQLARILGLPEDEVRILHMPAGGAFGGKTELTTHAPCAIASLKTGRPASMINTRKDAIRAHPKRHPYDMHYKIGATKDGKIVGMTADMTADAGAYASWSPRVLPQGISYSTGPYYVPSFDLHMQGIYTNNMVKGAMRGFGAIQSHFPVESLMDELAHKLGMSPLDLRRANALDKDKPMTTGQYPVTQSIDYKNTIVGAREIVDRLTPELEARRAAGELVGIGIASGWRSVAGGLGPDETAGAKFTLKPDGRVTLGIACTEMGQGSHTSLAQMAAEVTGVAWQDFDIVAGDTDDVPFGGGVMASRGLYLWGHPTIKAGEQFEEKIIQAAEQVYGVQADDIKLQDSKLVSTRGEGELATLADLAAKLDDPIVVQVDFTLPKSNPVAENTNEDGHIPQQEYNPHQTVSYNTTVAMVKVDPAKGDVKVLYMGAVCDGGVIVNPDAAATQIEGALIMGTGFGMTNDFKIENGVNVTNSLGKCKIPRIDNMPERLEVHWTPDSACGTGPFGAKGIAEVAVLTPAPAIGNALFDAVGYRLTDLPVCNHKDEIKEAAAARLAERQADGEATEQAERPVVEAPVEQAA